MTCAEFLERYTDFRDGLITAPRELRRFERHLVRCAGCRRYDTAVRRGVLALQAAGTIEPSRDFRRRLDARLERERRAAREVPASAGVAAALVLAAALAMLALEGVRRPEVARAPVLPPVPFPNPVVQAGVPFVSLDRKSTRLNSSHRCISYAVFCLKKKKNNKLASRNGCPSQRPRWTCIWTSKTPPSAIVMCTAPFSLSSFIFRDLHSLIAPS